MASTEFSKIYCYGQLMAVKLGNLVANISCRNFRWSPGNCFLAIPFFILPRQAGSRWLSYEDQQYPEATQTQKKRAHRNSKQNFLKGNLESKTPLAIKNSSPKLFRYD